MKSESNVSIYRPTQTHTHIHTHTRTVYAQIICPLHCCFSILLTQSARREHHRLHTFFSFRRAYLSFLSSTIYTFVFLHLPTKKNREKQNSRRFLYVLMITMMIIYTLLPLEKFNNEIHSSMLTIGEIDRSTREKNEKELDICLIK